MANLSIHLRISYISSEFTRIRATKCKLSVHIGFGGSRFKRNANDFGADRTLRKQIVRNSRDGISV